MGQRIYEITFEMFTDGEWHRNSFARNIAVVGGAEQAIKVAMQREKKDDKESNVRVRYRVEQVKLIAEES